MQPLSLSFLCVLAVPSPRRSHAVLLSLLFVFAEPCVGVGCGVSVRGEVCVCVFVFRGRGGGEGEVRAVLTPCTYSFMFLKCALLTLVDLWLR